MGTTDNQNERRREIVHAAWRVILKEGVHQASMRAIARELGSTTGVVTHYFRDKDELMLSALDQLVTELLQAWKDALVDVTGLARLEKMLLAALPLTTDDGYGWHIWVAFLGYSIGRPPLVDEHRNRYERMRELLMKELQALEQQSALRPDLNLDLEANAMIALVDGIGIDFVINPLRYPPADQRFLVKRHLQTLLRTPE